MTIRRVYVASYLVMLIGAVTLLSATENGSASQALQIWNDPTFQKRFLGSYGTNAEITR